MTRVLLVYQPTDGGVGRHLRDLAAGLGGAGFEVALCGPSDLGLSEHPHRNLDMRRAIAPAADAAGVARLARIVGELRPEVIHAHSSKAGALARLARAAHPRTPVLYSPHGYAFAGYFARESTRRAYRAVERLLAPLASTVLCVCESEARLARAVGARRVRVVHNGIAAPPTLPPPQARVAALARRGPVLGALTLLRPGKGLQTLIDALPEVLAAHPRAQTAIVGEGPDRASLGERARRLGVQDSVHFLGPSAEPYGVLAGMDVFVHPSWAESFPYVILEAMSMGRAIVASDVGGIGEALTSGEQGLLTRPRDPVALARSINALLGDPVRAAALGRSAALRAAGEFTLQAMVDGVAGAYREALGSVAG